MLVELTQPPSGGCELKPAQPGTTAPAPTQPPSGGCELKPSEQALRNQGYNPAAFGRL